MTPTVDNVICEFCNAKNLESVNYFNFIMILFFEKKKNKIIIYIIIKFKYISQH